MGIKTLVQYNYMLLIGFLILVIIILFFMLLRERRKRGRKKSRVEDLYTIIEPIKYSLDTLKIDKTKYLNAFNEAKEEIRLYSEHILNMVDAGILLLDDKNSIIYQNNWFEDNNFDIKLLLDKKISYEIIYNEKTILVTIRKHIDYIVFILNDITELKELEDQIIAKEKLAYLGEMSASIAHEFKNSLAVIKGFVTILKKRSDKEDIVKDVAIDIDEEINYFYGILTDYLSYSREIIINKNSFSVIELINEIKKNLFSKEKELIKISATLKKITLNADRDKIKQVLINLIKNGLEASETGVEISFVSDEKKQIIEVIDNGEGITADLKKKIFNPFFTTKEHGTGLGLAISYNIIIAHNGKLEVLDNTPKGTIFRIILHKE